MNFSEFEKMFNLFKLYIYPYFQNCNSLIYYLVTGIDVDLACAVIFAVCIVYTTIVRNILSPNRTYKNSFFLNHKYEMYSKFFFNLKLGRYQSCDVDRYISRSGHVWFISCCYYQRKLWCLWCESCLGPKLSIWKNWVIQVIDDIIIILLHFW